MGVLDFLGTFGATDRERNRLENDAKREALNTSRRRTDLLGRLPGALAPLDRQSPELNRNPVTGRPISMAGEPVENLDVAGAQAERQGNLQGILAELAPEQMAAAQFQRPPRNSTEDKFGSIESRLGRKLTEDEVFSIVNPGEGGLESLKLQLEVRQLMAEIQDEASVRTDRKLAAQDAFPDGLDQILQMAKLNDQLDESFLESGGSYNEAKRIIAPLLAAGADLTGFDQASRDLKNSVEAFDTLTKTTAVFAGTTIKAMAAIDVNVTNQLQKLIEKQNASVNVSPGTNRSIFKLLTKELLRGADRKGIDLPHRAQYEEMLRKLDTTTLEFFSQEEIENAFEAGAIKIGDTILFNGERRPVNAPPAGS